MKSNLFILPCLAMAAVISAFSARQAMAQNFEWSVGIGGEWSDRAFGIAKDNDGNIYTTGGFSDTVDFDPGPDVHELRVVNPASPLAPATFITKMDPNGKLIWAKQFDAISANGHSFGNNIFTDASGNTYVAGFFTGTIDFDPGPDVFELSTPLFGTTFIVKLDKDGNFKWAKSMPNLSYTSFLDEEAKKRMGIIASPAGDLYVTGAFIDTVFDLVSNEVPSGLVLKLNTDGDLVWAKKIGNYTKSGSGGGSGAGTAGHNISLDDDENVYVTGIYNDNEGSFDFDKADQAITGAGVFITKLDKSGSFIWTKAFTAGTNASDEVGSYGIAADNTGNVFISGAFRGKANFHTGVGDETLEVLGQKHISDAFIAKLDHHGDLLWVKQIGGDASGGNILKDIIWDLGIDGGGNVVYTANFEGKVNFDPGDGTFYLGTDTISPSLNYIVVSSLDADGNFLWANKVGGASEQMGRRLVMHSDNIYVAGSFRGDAFEPGSGLELQSHGPLHDILIFKIKNSNSTLIPENKLLSPNLTVYPNPAKDIITIKLSDQEGNYRAAASIFSLDGRKVSRHEIRSGITEIDIRNIPPGAYLLKVVHQATTSYSKIIKE